MPAVTVAGISAWLASVEKRQIFVATAIASEIEIEPVTAVVEAVDAIEPVRMGLSAVVQAAVAVDVAATVGVIELV